MRHTERIRLGRELIGTNIAKVLAVLCLWSGMTWMVLGQQPIAFRVNTDIYEDETKPPIRTTETLFFEGVYYDFDDSNSDWISVIDPAHERIVLLDRKRKVKTELRTFQLQQMVQEARALLTTDQKRKLTSEGALVQDAATNEWVLGNDSVQYRCETIQPPEPQIAQMYAEFADWSARLNAVNPPHLPAFMRLDLNSELAERKLMPKTIKKVTSSRGRKSVLTAKILPTWRVSAEDETAIARVGTYLVEFKLVTQEEFYR